MIQSVPTVAKREASYLKRHTTFLSPTVVDVNKATPAACDMGSLPDPVQKLAGKGPMSFDKMFLKMENICFLVFYKTCQKIRPCGFQVYF